MYSFDVSYGLKSISDVYDLLEFFNSVRGMGHSFRFKDPIDYKSCAPGGTVASTDVIIGTGDASEVDFQLKKIYATGSLSADRYITKPIAGTVVVSLDDVPQGSGWTVDTTTGIVTFSSPPGGSVVVKAGFEFHVPCRFDTDHLPVGIETPDIGEVQSIKVIEDREYSIPS